MRASNPLPGVYIDGNPANPTVVLLHSIATSSDIWKPLIASYASVFQVVCLDIPGHGNAPRLTRADQFQDYVDYANEVLDALRLRPQAVIGISLGGMIAQSMALSADTLQALVLANCSDFTNDSVKSIWDERLASAKLLGMASQVQPTLSRWFTPDFIAHAPLCMKWIEGLIVSTSLDGYADAVRTIKTLDHRQALRSLQIPVLAIAGACDQAVGLPAIEQMVKNMPRGRMLTLPETAHLSCVEAPFEFAEYSANFILQAIK